MTPSKTVFENRVEEIHIWLASWATNSSESVTDFHWVALDDMDLNYDKRMHGHFVKINPDLGLTHSDTDIAINILKGEPMPNQLSEEEIRALVGCGYPRDLVIQALTKYGSDSEKVMKFLFSNGSIS